MWHVVAHARPGTLLFFDWREGLLLWESIGRGAECVAAVVMPDHVHVLLRHRAAQSGLVRALAGFARTRNARRGERAAVWCPGIDGTPVCGPEHVRRTMRYIHLNPCRKGLARDPLEWPLSTHRECVGLALRPIRAPLREPRSFHAFVSADPSVDPRGTELPALCPKEEREVSTDAVRAAVSALLRATPDDLHMRGPARSLLLSAAGVLSSERLADVARVCRVCVRTVQRASPLPARSLRALRAVLFDPRFPALHEGDLRALPEWKAYRGRR